MWWMAARTCIFLMSAIRLGQWKSIVSAQKIFAAKFCPSQITLPANLRWRFSPSSEEAITNAPPQLVDTVRIVDGAFSFTLHGVPESV